MTSGYPRKHEPNEALGITPEIAAKLDAAMAEMETGTAGGDVVNDVSSETLENIHPADIGTSSHSLAKGSSNEQVRFGALVEAEKNADPSIEHSEAYDRAVEKFESMVAEEDDE